MKKNILCCLSLISLMTLMTISNARADYKGFAGSTKYSYEKVGTENAKNNYQYLAGVNWTESDHSNHKEWFQIRNSNGEDRGTVLINRPNTGVVYFDTTAKYGYDYTLWASREHIINPSTYVKGTWQP